MKQQRNQDLPFQLEENLLSSLDRPTDFGYNGSQEQKGNFMKENLPRLIVLGQSGTGKAEFARKLSGYKWNHFDIDELLKNKPIHEIVREIPAENYTVLNWTILTDDLNFVAELIFNKGYSCLVLRSDEAAVDAYLTTRGFDKKFINSKRRKTAEKEALESLIWLFSNVSRVMTGDYFKPDGTFKDEEFVSSYDFYYRKKGIE